MTRLNSKNPWHDLKSSLTAMKLGLNLLAELPEIKNLKSEEVSETLKQIINKCELSIKQSNKLQGDSHER